MSLGLQRFLVLVAALAVLASGCTGSSGDGIASATAEQTAVETATVEPTTEPTPTAGVLSDQATLAAAQEAFEADPQPTDLIAYDLIEVRARGTTGVTEVVVCGWKEDSVFNEIYVVAYRVRQADDGTATVAFESANTISEDCLNTDMVDTAFEATRRHDVFWTTVSTDPSSFDLDTALEIFVPELMRANAGTVETWAADGLAYRGTNFDAMLPESSITEVLGRRYKTGEFEVLEIIACRDLPQNYGLYRGDVLIDDFRTPEGQNGTHSTIQYQLIRRDGQWFILGVGGGLWTNCLGFEDGWFSAVNRLLPDPVGWTRLPQ